MEILITGSSGLIGTALVEALTGQGHRPVGLVRRPASGADEIRWSPADDEIDAASLEGFDGVVHLAGAGIGDKRWNDEYRRVLVESRTGPTALLAKTLAALDRPPSVLLSGSAIGFYGDRGDELLTEESGAGRGFLPDLVTAWEAAAQPAAAAGIRTAFLRTGIVLTNKGGALGKLLPLFKFGLGGKMGSGRQYWSWITLADEVGAIMHLLRVEVAGPVNLTAPEPVTNAAFTEALGDVLGRPTFVPVPSFGPKVLLGAEMAQSLLFDSQRILPDVLTLSGYRFAQPDISSGLRAAVDD
ncbi:MAG: TIGR01777 family oxidoreductase [Acidimicrobiales bacterium]